MRVLRAILLGCALLLPATGTAAAAMGEQQELFEKAEDFLRDLQTLAEVEDALDRLVEDNAETPAVAEKKENAADFEIDDEGRRTTAEETPEEKRGGEDRAFGYGGSTRGGTVYIRWGRTTCPNRVRTSLLYKGLAGGSHYNQAGGANYVCLPENPEWGNFNSGLQKNAYMYGAEYEVSLANPFKTHDLHDHDVPCAVCYARFRIAQVMIPARVSCPRGWTREYKGYLMTERHIHRRSEFVCVDEQAEVRPSGNANRDGALFYPVDGVCGSLPCPPYVEGRELTCVVCTK